MRKLLVKRTSVNGPTCPECGYYTGDGVEVYLDSELIYEVKAWVTCYDGSEVNETEMWTEVFNKLGVEYEEEYT